MPFSPNKLLPIARLAVLGSVSFLSLITLILSAHIVHFTTEWLSFFFDYAALGVAVSVLTLVTFPAMIFVGRARTGAVPTYIAFELGWTGFLWILWLAFAATTATLNQTGGRCSNDFTDWITLCGETNAIEAFGFLNWLMLLAYFGALLVSTIMAFQAGNKQIWTSAVNDADFEGASTPSYAYDKNQPATLAPQYPPTNMMPGTVTTQAISHPPASTPSTPQV